jgi:diguanylate cyclase (GGDEF)-like protein
MDHQEINIRIQAVLRRYKQNLDSNPLTHLPGNNIIQKVVARLIDLNKKFAVVYADLDNFKAYNDKYGFIQGDKMLLFTAKLLENIVSNYGNFEDFLGHVGGDDFIFITTPDKVVQICEAVKNEMDSKISALYNEEDQQRGYIISKDRRGEVQKFPFVTISMAVVSNENREIVSIAEISVIASELKKLSKTIDGNSYVFDKRKI